MLNVQFVLFFISKGISPVVEFREELGFSIKLSLSHEKPKLKFLERQTCFDPLDEDQLSSLILEERTSDIVRFVPTLVRQYVFKLSYDLYPVRDVMCRALYPAASNMVIVVARIL